MPGGEDEGWVNIGKFYFHSSCDIADCSNELEFASFGSLVDNGIVTAVTAEINCASAEEIVVGSDGLQGFVGAGVG